MARTFETGFIGLALRAAYMPVNIVQSLLKGIVLCDACRSSTGLRPGV